MARRGFSRRAMLRGMFLGSAVSVALPPLELFMNIHRKAHAADNAFPKRFCLFFWGSGTIPELWIPPTTGTDMHDKIGNRERIRFMI